MTIYCNRLIELLEKNNFIIDNQINTDKFCVIDIKLNEMITYFVDYFTKNPDIEIHDFSKHLFSSMSLEVKPDNSIYIEFPIPKEAMCLLFETFNFKDFAGTNEIKIHFWEVNHIHIETWKNVVPEFLELLSKFYNEVDILINSSTYKI